MIQLQGITKSFDGNTVLQSIDLLIPTGDRLVLLGPSGSGKSTLLRLLAGLDEPDSGKILFDGQDFRNVPPHRRNLVLVPQRPAFYPHLTVRENLERQPLSSPSAKPLSLPQIVDILRISPLLERFTHQLSGGERQRLALARAARSGAGVWLLDEPFAALDPLLHSEIRQDLHLLLNESLATIVLVTHDPIDALALGHHVGVLGEGRLQQLGSPETVRRLPQNRYVAFALGQMNFVPGKVIERIEEGGDSPATTFVSVDGTMVVPLTDPEVRQRVAPSAHNLTLGIRPEDVFSRDLGSPTRLTPVWELPEWRVVFAEPVGSGWVLTISRDSSRLRVGWPSGSPPPLGDPHNWWIQLNDCIWFDDQGHRIG